MKSLARRICFLLMVAFLAMLLGTLASGCGACGPGDLQCYTYSNGQTICYEQDHCDEEEEE